MFNTDIWGSFVLIICILSIEHQLLSTLKVEMSKMFWFYSKLEKIKIFIKMLWCPGTQESKKYWQ